MVPDPGPMVRKAATRRPPVVDGNAISGQGGWMTSSTEVRTSLESLLERDLLGPWDGPTEELPPRVISTERYLLGRLVPRIPFVPIPED
jgi:hypothetical protein